ncbi:uncharacterized protein LOC135401325 isoform X2 [Ornithodoros turicata]|uniref:uncharacterized protein LOC135401325 isoform X2 n=1 Tax=Ornithodoros turicata TaxID=34597 RepID=UPI003139003E
MTDVTDGVVAIRTGSDCVRLMKREVMTRLLSKMEIKWRAYEERSARSALLEIHFPERDIMRQETQDDCCSVAPGSFCAANEHKNQPKKQKRLRALRAEPPSDGVPNVDGKEMTSTKRYLTRFRGVKLGREVAQKNIKKTLTSSTQDDEGSNEQNDVPPEKKRKFFSAPLQVVWKATKCRFSSIAKIKKSWNSGFVVRRASTQSIASNPTLIRPALRGGKDHNEIVMIVPTPKLEKQTLQCEPGATHSGSGVQPQISKQILNHKAQEEKENEAATHGFTWKGQGPLAHSTPYSARHPDEDLVESRTCPGKVNCTSQRRFSSETEEQIEAQALDMYSTKSSSCFSKADDGLGGNVVSLSHEEARDMGAAIGALFPVFHKNAWEPSPVNRDVATALPRFQKKLLRAAQDPLQLIIDAGQKKFGIVTCQECSMTYSAGEADDEVAHQRHHEQQLGPLKFLGWKKERIVGVGLTPDSRIVMVLPSDEKYILSKVTEIQERVERELGHEDEQEPKAECSHFIYVAQKQVVGYLSAVPLKEAYRVVRPKGDTNSESITYNPEPVQARCGVSRVWVADSHRRKKIATRLLGCLRKNFTSGDPLEVTELAFSVPTVTGQQLAAAYSRTEEFLIYW